MLAGALAVIHGARPRLTLFSRAILDAILLTERSIGSAETVARRLGLRNRFQLARMLRREGLPPLHRLAGWATVLSWVVGAERRGESLSATAFHSRRHPSACYRLVKEITGRRWEYVRAKGSDWVQDQFLREFRKRRNRS